VLDSIMAGLRFVRMVSTIVRLWPLKRLTCVTRRRPAASRGSHTDYLTISRWRDSDPTCKRWLLNNALTYFAEARAQKIGLAKLIRPAQKKTCPLCNNDFVEDSLWIPLVQRFGLDGLDY